MRRDDPQEVVAGRVGLSLSEMARVAWRAIAANPLRSALTALGVVIGVAAVVALTMVGQGTTQRVTRLLEGLGTNLLTVGPAQGGRGPGGGLVRGGGPATLPLADAYAIQEAFAGEVVGVAPVAQANFQLKYGAQNLRATVVGTWPDFAQVRNAEPDRGGFFTWEDVEARRRVAVIGYGIAQDLFGGEDPLGQRLRIAGIPFTVVGVLPDKGDQGFVSTNYQVYVPLSTYLQRLSRPEAGGAKVNTIYLQGADRDRLKDLQEHLTQFLAQRHGLWDPQSYDFSVTNQQDALESVNQTTRAMTLFLGGVAGISLLVGGIGIMNIMLVSVTERTREIGVRKALGARPQDILGQFLAESVVLSVGGGLLGVAVGLLMARFVGQAISVTPVFSPTSIVVAFFFAVVVGVFFGLYPAWRAARLDPVEALRYE
ncbi:MULTISPECIES: ABC transporter permease [Thermus]|jgi:putative ABC transport system permease protein|uniref:ABC transporter permease n=1 Tax=Thermus brockianus TaxID=56956 RepID=A0ABN6NJY9_THEBO|nr:ABC transporter permease [Thermus brockianus]BDG17295.1 ABC transporter permease [Thermus brockianus]